ncbi:MAG TPA: hypothetical protein VFU76_01890 [Terriglobales bacterium]|nr:hypothetical protein [Terriglobales bacterium]
MPSRKRSPRKGSKRTVVKLAPETPAARDEGPRLIPLGPEKEEPRLKHLLDLADTALGNHDKADRKH